MWLAAGTVINPDGTMTRDGQPAGDFVQLQRQATGAAADTAASLERDPGRPPGPGAPPRADESEVPEQLDGAPTEWGAATRPAGDTTASQQHSSLPVPSATASGTAADDGRRADATPDTGIGGHDADGTVARGGPDDAGSGIGEVHADLGPSGTGGDTGSDTDTGFGADLFVPV